MCCHGAVHFDSLHAAIAAFEEADPACPREGLPPGAGIFASLLHAAETVARELAIRCAFGGAFGMFLYDLCRAISETRTGQPKQLVGLSFFHTAL